MDRKIYENYVRILENELVPALGCTEPIALAYASAKARETLGEFPEHLSVLCSGNIIKNVKGVKVPNSGGMKGVEAAAVLGVTGGDPGQALEVLETVTAVSYTHLAKIMKSIISEIKQVKCEGILLIVSNPVDILTQVALQESGLPKERVIGSGTVLDTARLKYLISEKLKVDSRNVHAFIAGEHGDSELAVWSCANIYGISLDEFAKMKGFTDFKKEKDQIYHAVRDSAYEIIERKGATYYGIGMAAAKIAEAIVRDSHTAVSYTHLTAAGRNARSLWTGRAGWSSVTERTADCGSQTIRRRERSRRRHRVS